MAALKDEINHPKVFEPHMSSADIARSDNQGLKALKDVAFGSTAGMLAKYVEYPFDTVKVRLQSQGGVQGSQQLTGPIDAFKAAFRSPEGPIRSLYRGISAPLFGAAVETSSLFFSYRVVQDIFIAISPELQRERDANKGRVDLPFMTLLFCGGASGAFTSMLLTPIELVKCKMQVPIEQAVGQAQIPTKLPGPLTIITQIFRSHGVFGFWHGQLGTLIRETGGSASWFGSYEGSKLLFMRYDKSLRTADDIKMWQQLCAGASAGMAYNFVFYPADTIKSRMQTEDTGTGKTKGSFVQVGNELWKQQGIRGFYRGCGITVARSAPSSAMIFSIYEGLKRYFA